MSFPFFYFKYAYLEQQQHPGMARRMATGAHQLGPARCIVGMMVLARTKETLQLEPTTIAN